MAKKFIATIALVLACLFAFVACSGENYDFQALADTPDASAPVRSNGGVYVEKGNYSYFVNFAEDGLADNTFGEYHEGSIVRCKTADLFDSERTIETVVPKIIYAYNPDSAGFYIYGDRIYYTTPNNQKDAQGIVQNNKLDFMMANLDGTGTQLVATVDNNEIEFRIIENNEKVYILYVDGETIKRNDEDVEVTSLYQIDTESKEKEVVESDIDTYVFDRVDGSKSIAYTKKAYKFDVTGKEVAITSYNVLKQYFAGTSEPKVVAEGKDESKIKYENMTVVALKNDVVYFNVEGAVSAKKEFCKASNGNVTVLAQDTFSDIFVSANSNVIYAQKNSAIYKVEFENGNIKTFEKLCAEGSDIKFEYEDVANNRLYYSYQEDFKLVSIATNEGISKKESAIYNSTRVTWFAYDFATIDGKTAVLYFEDASGIKFINYLYVCVQNGYDSDDKWSLTTKRLGLLSETKQQYAIEEGDDTFAVEDFASKQ